MSTELRALDSQSLELLFTLRNTGGLPMSDCEADFCFACARLAWHRKPEDVARSWVTAAFHGPRREFNTDWTTRSFVATRSGLTAVNDIDVHYPVAANAALTFGRNVALLPLILCQSVDRTEVYAAGWERCTRLYCAVGSCIHTAAWLGTVLPGRSVTLRGRFYHAATDPYRILARFQAELLSPG